MDFESLIENEREWRLFLVEKVNKIEEGMSRHAKELAHQAAWSLVFRIIGSSLFALVLAWIEYSSK